MDTAILSFAEYQFGKGPSVICLDFSHAFLKQLHREWCFQAYERWFDEKFGTEDDSSFLDCSL